MKGVSGQRKSSNVGNRKASDVGIEASKTSSSSNIKKALKLIRTANTEIHPMDIEKAKVKSAEMKNNHPALPYGESQPYTLKSLKVDQLAALRAVLKVVLMGAAMAVLMVDLKVLMKVVYLGFESVVS